MEKTFAEGLIFKLPSEKALDFVKGSLSIKVDEFIAFLEKNAKNGWVNVNLKLSKGGKAYAELDTWEPKDRKEVKADEPPAEIYEEEIKADQIPF